MYEVSPSLKEAQSRLKNLEKLMASLTEKFKLTFNGTSGTTTTSSSFLRVTPVERNADDEFVDK